MNDKYVNDRSAIYGYAGDVWEEVSHWNSSAYRLKEAGIDRQAFTALGGRIAAAYEDLVTDYSWTAWRICVTLDRLMKALDETAQAYGEAEAKVEDDINNIGRQL